MSRTYDAIIIGGGHNGLVTAGFLARAGQKTLVLERRHLLGGAAATEEIFPGFKANTGAVDAGLLRAEVMAELNLRRHGLDFIDSPVTVFAPQPEGPALCLWQNMRQTQTGLARLSPADADRFPAFVRLLAMFTGVLDYVMTLTPPNLAGQKVGELLPWLKTAADMKRLDSREMMEFLRVLPLSVAEFLNEWFESELLKGVLGSVGISGSLQGPRAGGTAFMLLYHYLGAASTGFKASRFVRGGIGQLAAALTGAARQYGAELRTGAEVSRVMVTDGRAVGVVLANGEEISARRVVSNADPRRTFFNLVDPLELEPRFVRLVKNIRYRGCTAKVNLALSGLPRFSGQPAEDGPYLGGHILISPSLDYLERAYDEAKYGRFSPRPYLDVVIPSVLDPSLAPAGQHVMSITMQYAPYDLRQSNWDEQRAALGDKIIDTLAEVAPGLKDLILHRQVITPLDWEREYGLTAGDIFHGQMGLDQLLFMRPVAGWGRYRTPIKNLYLCGAGAHPGGGVTGAPGYIAARQILKDL
ncbi:MAG: NAD(P)/FAD-dependent oxidoreductase [Chloroflexota bacterium]